MKNKITILILALLYLTVTVPVQGKTIITVEKTVTLRHKGGSYQMADMPKPSVTPRIKETPKATQAPAPSLSKIFDTIHLLETTRGTAPSGHHVYCRNNGGWNEIGYNPQGKFCFKSKEEAMNKVERWFDNKFKKGYTVAEAACMWNIGVRTGDCPYGKHF